MDASGRRRAGAAPSRDHVLALRRAEQSVPVRSRDRPSRTTSSRSTSRSIAPGSIAPSSPACSYGGLIAANLRRAVPIASPGWCWPPRCTRRGIRIAQQQRFLAVAAADVADVRGDGADADAAGADRRVAAIGAACGSRPRIGLSVVLALASPAKMARRIAWAQSHQFADVARRQGAGAAGHRRARTSIASCRSTCRGVTWTNSHGREHVVLKRTGHIGVVTRPDAFAGVLERFVDGVRLSA